MRLGHWERVEEEGVEIRIEKGKCGAWYVMTQAPLGMSLEPTFHHFTYEVYRLDVQRLVKKLRMIVEGLQGVHGIIIIIKNYKPLQSPRGVPGGTF